MCITLSTICTVGCPRNSLNTEFCRHGIPSKWNSVDMEFRRHGIPSSWNSVDMDFRRHGILSTRNSVDTEFRRHGIPSTRNSIDMDFHGHRIPHIFFFYFCIYSMLCYATYFCPNFDRNSAYKNTRNSVDF